MQVRVRVAAASLMDDAESAWRDGELDRCLALCESVPDITVIEPRDALRLLRLRVDALRVLQRPDDAVAAAQRSQVPRGRDGHSAAAAALGLALNFTQTAENLARSEVVLRDALSTATTVDEREDAAILLALRHYIAGDFDRATPLLRTVPRRQHSNYARRLEIDAWIAYQRLEFETATRTFESALVHLDCVPHDKRLELNILFAAADYAVESLDIARWLPLAKRAAACEPIPQCLWWQNLALHNCYSATAEIVGHPDAALEQADCMNQPTFPLAVRIMSMCRKAAILGRYGEPLAHRNLAGAIWRAYDDALPFGRPVHSVELLVYDAVAEIMAFAGDVKAAEKAMNDKPVDAGIESPWFAHPFTEGQRQYVRGLVADVRGEPLQARHHLRTAFEAFTRIGFHRQGIIIAQALAEIDDDPALLRYIDGHARRLGPRSWLRQRFARTVNGRENPILAELSRAERHVLELLMAGESTDQIATMRGRSPKTIRNTFSALFKRFGVDNRQALLCECLRRGIAPNSYTAQR